MNAILRHWQQHGGSYALSASQTEHALFGTCRLLRAQGEQEQQWNAR
jgi:hypothetical protein